MENKLSFEISETPVLYNANGETITSKSHKAIIKENGALLSVMKSTYNPMKNEDFMESVNRMAEISGFEIAGYSEFKGGKTVLGHLKNNIENFEIGGHKIKDYLVLGSSFDGTHPFFIGTSTILIRCTNAFSHISQVEKVRHTKSAPKKREELFQALQVYFSDRKKMYNSLEKMMKVKVDRSIIEAAKEYVFKLSKQDMLEGNLSTRKTNQMEMVHLDILGEMHEVGGTAFGLFQGFTKYTTHTANQKDDNKVFGNIFGTVSEVNKRAYQFATSLI